MAGRQVAGHRIRWFVYAGGERIPHAASMRGLWGYDVECSCGWATHTGGGTRSSLEFEVWCHKRSVAED